VNKYAIDSSGQLGNQAVTYTVSSGKQTRQWHKAKSGSSHFYKQHGYLVISYLV